MKTIIFLSLAALTLSACETYAGSAAPSKAVPAEVLLGV